MTLSAYLHESGFSDDPFADTEDASLYFATPQLTQRLDLLEHLILYSDLLLLVSGETGSGKTTLLNRLVSMASQPWRVSVVQADVEMDPGGLLRKAMQGFDMGAGQPAAREQADDLRHACLRWRSRSQVPVLAIDEAHMLPPDTLAAAVRLAAETGGSGLRMLLLGEPQLEQMLGEAINGGGSNAAHVVDLPALNRHQSAAYLRHRLSRAGLDAQALFPDVLVDRVVKGSAGLPGRLNAAARSQLADRLATAEHRPDAGPRSPGRVPWWRRGPLRAFAAVLLAALVAALWLLTPEPSPPPERLALTPLKEYATPPPATVASSRAAEPSPPQAEPVPMPVETVVESAAVEEAAALPPPARATPLAPLPPAPQDASNATAERVLEPAPKAVALENAPAGPVPPKPQRRSIRPASQAAAPDAVPLPPELAGLQDEAWLMAQDPGHYTVQLTGTHDRQAALSFVRNHSLQDAAAWFRTRHRNRDWYVVVTGTYSQRADAQAAIRSLSAALKRQGPWPRTFASIQASVAGSAARPD